MMSTILFTGTAQPPKRRIVELLYGGRNPAANGHRQLQPRHHLAKELWDSLGVGKKTGPLLNKVKIP
jgi:hypothetical protein